MSNVAEERGHLLLQIETLQARLDQLEAEDTGASDDRGSFSSEGKTAREQVAPVPDQLLKYHIAHSPLGVIEWDRLFRVIRWSQRAEEIFGWTPSEALGKRWDELRLVHVDDVDRVTELGGQLITGQVDFSTCDTRNYRKDGKVIHCEWFNSAIRNEDGIVISQLSLVHDVTDRKLAEESLSASEAKFRALVEHSYDVINMFSPNGELLYTSPCIERVLGFRPDEMMNLHPSEVVHPEDFEQAEREFRSCLDKPGSVGHFTHRLRHKDGSYRTVEVTGMNLLDDPGIHAMVSIFRDISDRKHAEKAARDSQRMLRTVIDNIPQGVFWKDRESRYLGMNRRVTEAFGLAMPESLIGKTDHDITSLTPQQADFFIEKDREVISSEQEQREIVERARLADGSEVWLETNKLPLRDERGDVIGVLGTWQDITERKRAEETLKQRLEFEALLSKMSSAFVSIPADNIRQEIDSWLGVVAEFIDVDRAGIAEFSADKSLVSLKHEWLAPGIAPAIEQFQNINTEPMAWLKKELLRGKAVVIPSVSNLPDEAANARSLLQGFGVKASIAVPLVVFNNVVGDLFFDVAHGERDWPNELVNQLNLVGELFANALARNQTDEELRASEAALRQLNVELEQRVEHRTAALSEAMAHAEESEQKLAAILDNTSFLIGLCKSDGTLLQANRAVYSNLEFPESAWLGRPLWEGPAWPSDEVRSEVRETLNHAAGGTFCRREILHQRSDGSTAIFDFSVSPIRDEDGNVVMLVPEGRDISELKRIEQELQERNAELQAFAHTVTHDLRAPVRAIEGFATAVAEDYGERLDDEGHEYIRHIVRSAQKMELLIKDLLAYGRLGRANVHLRDISLDVIVREVLEQLSHDIGERDAVIETADSLPVVEGHGATLEQIVTNLVSNALKFVEQGVHPKVKIWSEQLSNSRIRLWIEDNGIGIDADAQDRIFQPFERLHGIESYPGTGFGLAIVVRACDRLGGACGVESQPGRGSRFWVELGMANSNP